MSSWNHVSSRLGNVQPATKAIAKEIYDAASDAGHEIWFMWGMGTSSEHATGRALDLMVRNKAAGDFIKDYVWKNRKRLRLRHVIWWQAITSTVVRPGVTRRMNDRGNATANHKDHPHIFILPGAYQPPPRLVTPDPKPASKPVAEDWVGKVVVAKTDVNFYRKPGWAPANRTAGVLPANWGFRGGIHAKHKVGGGWQYLVSNSSGMRFWITANPKFVELRPMR